MERTPAFQVTAFGNYYLLERIAVGGMAEIFKAKQVGVRGFEKIVVVKRILQHLSEDPEFVEMFEDEAKLAAQLNQANIVQIYELGEVDENLYITMEFIEGKNLRDVTRAASGKGIHLSIEQSVFIVSEILKGLEYAHRKPDSQGDPLHLIHRDISPQNVIVSYEGEVKIVDFGIAKAASKISKTEAGVLKGKFSYMSPEQASGKEIDQTSDLYATGVMLHELLTSDRLFRSKSDLETLDKVKAGIVEAPSQKNSLIPPELDRIVLKALAKERDKRYPTASHFYQDLQKFVSDFQYMSSSQEISAFMKSLFAESIQEERVRLQEALSRIPKTPTQQLQNARTHIAFKRDDSKPTEAPPGEMTQTFQRRSETQLWQNANFRLALLVVLIVVTTLLIVTPAKKNSPLEEQKSSSNPMPLKIPELIEESAEPPPPSPSLKKVETIIQKQAETAPTLSPSERFPEPRPVAEKPKQAPAPRTPSAAQPGIVNMLAPKEGFARLFINEEPRGTVPGPQARNIRLPAGTHNIRCETSARTYSGKVSLKAGETLNVSCDGLSQ
jgi:serine/threonine protein kinase